MTLMKPPMHIDLFGATHTFYHLARVFGIPISLMAFGPWLGNRRGVPEWHWYFYGFITVVLSFCGAYAFSAVIHMFFTNGIQWGGWRQAGPEGVAGVATGMISFLLFNFRFPLVKRPYNPDDLSDALAAPASLMVAFLKLGCWGALCCYGIPYSGPFAIFPPPLTNAWRNQVRAGLISPKAELGFPVFPTQPAEMFYALLLCGIFTWLYVNGKLRGLLLYLFFEAYLLWRILSETFLRADPSRGKLAGGFTGTQGLSLVLMIVTAGLIVSTLKRQARATRSG